jgi:acetyl esterase/lipase
LLEHGADEFGSDRLLIGGESAGAHLAAVTLLRMRDKHQVADRFLGANLVFGAYDLSRTPSQRGVGIAPGTDILDATGFPLDLFLPGMSEERRRDPDVSPLYGDLRDMPPALFSVGSNDHLLDDTLFMAPRWEVAGNRSELLVYPETPHGCIALPSVAGHFFPRLFDFFGECLETRLPVTQS